MLNIIKRCKFSIIDAVHYIILTDRRTRPKQISEVPNISYETIHHMIPVDLDMRKMSTKYISKCLKRATVGALRSICARFKNDADSLSRVVLWIKNLGTFL